MATDPKPGSVNGRVAAGQVLVMSSAQSLASQQGHILQRQQLLPAIGQTAMGSVLLPSTPESANVGVVCDLQMDYVLNAHREVTVSDPSIDKTVAVVVTNPAVMHAVQISALNTVPVKLICGSPQLTETIQRSNLKGDLSSVKTAAVSEKDKRKLSIQEGEKTTNVE
ncbi:hypothetical protein J437_LFUL013136 [Ladona fulva]|uniref:Uncharacterized protein n=1 Tax=Ladona fulva TaxID=123851 RepID=A0A8K0P4B4_LADFU|nr:hypothetical protein J437_LFUL013136 [Ladona fulva]